MLITRFKLRILLPLAILSLTVGAIAVLAFASVVAGGKLGNAFSVVKEQQEQKKLIARLVELQKGIDIDIISVQESLTDISATRGLDGLDDGFQLAEQSAAALRSKVDELKKAGDRAGSAAIVEAAQKTGGEFETFYANGQKMAEAYVAEGPAGGNRLMATFDAESDRMQTQIEALSSAIASISARQDEHDGQQIAKIESDVLRFQWVALMMGAVLALLGAGMTALVLVRVVRPISGMTACMTKMASGNLDTTVPDTARSDEIGEMAQSVLAFQKAGLERLAAQAESAHLRQMSDEDAAERSRLRAVEAAQLEQVVQALGAGLGRLAECNIRMTIDEPFAPHFEPLRRDFNVSIATFQATLEQVLGKTASLSASSQEMREAANNLARRSEQQAAALEQTSASLEEVSSTVRASSERTAETRILAREARDCANASNHVVGEAVAAMKRIEDAAHQISQIIDVIDQIAFQTNLLALNAGVEAARAGEAGKGFAVVAQEVRELAQRSAGAAKEITALIRNSTEEVSNGVRLVDETGKALSKIGNFVHEIDTKVEAIDIASREQAIGLQEINSAVGSIDQMTQQNAAMVEESTAIGHGLATDAQTLTELVGRFKLNRRGAQREPNTAWPRYSDGTLVEGRRWAKAS